MKTIEVSALFTAKGSVIPLNFNDGTGNRRIHSTGRQWENNLGRHFLVMDSRQNAYHIIFDPKECVWHMVSGAHAPTIPV